jgi:hypothetical protein
MKNKIYVFKIIRIYRRRPDASKKIRRHETP